MWGIWKFNDVKIFTIVCLNVTFNVQGEANKGFIASEVDGTCQTMDKGHNRHGWKD